LSDRSVLITGAAGFIGSHLAERCLELGWRVIAVDAFTDYYDPARKRDNVRDVTGHDHYEAVEGDLLEIDLERLLREVSVVFHLAAQPGVRISWDRFDRYVRMNVNVTQRLLHAARDLPLEKVVIASSSSVYGDAETLPTSEVATPLPVSPYGVTKVATEQLAQVYCRSFSVPTVCLRYFTVYGPRQRPDMGFHKLIDSALRGEEFEIYGDGEQTRDFTFVRDAVAATISAAGLGRAGAAYNIGGGARTSLNTVLDMVGEILARPLARVYREAQPGDARHTAADTTRARSELEFVPACDLRSGLREQVAWQSSLIGATSG
jgi:nucleoside-diphosphate-sugar epimerase